uniref:Putative secreted protein n=1 Tax=Anopheles darlingi TaxID=43151 RepID=A0A2M4D159_ANODA
MVEPPQLLVVVDLVAGLDIVVAVPMVAVAVAVDTVERFVAALDAVERSAVVAVGWAVLAALAAERIPAECDWIDIAVRQLLAVAAAVVDDAAVAGLGIVDAIVAVQYKPLTVDRYWERRDVADAAQYYHRPDLDAHLFAGPVGLAVVLVDDAFVAAVADTAVVAAGNAAVAAAGHVVVAGNVVVAAGAADSAVAGWHSDEPGTDRLVLVGTPVACWRGAAAFLPRSTSVFLPGGVAQTLDTLHA